MEGRARWWVGAATAAILAAELDAAPSWIQGPSPAPGLGGRTADAAYDAARGRVVIFGGWTSPNLEDETWELDGLQWYPGPAAPSALLPRDNHAMAYDAARQVVVLVGGRTLSGFRRDVWEYDGTSWTQRANFGGSARAGHEMVYYPRIGATVLFGGLDGSALNDTWEYDGVNWTLARWRRRGLPAGTRTSWCTTPRATPSCCSAARARCRSSRTPGSTTEWVGRRVRPRRQG